MKTKIIASLIGIGAVILAFSPKSIQKEVNIDTKASKLEWFAEKVTGKHNGTVALKSGKVNITDGALTGGEFIVNMESIIVTDLEGEYKKKLEGHLKSEDFFDVENHKTSKLKLIEVKDLKGDDQFNKTIKAELTIKDITHEVSFPAKVKIENNKLAAYGELTIDRSKYNVRYGSASFFDNLGDKTIYDEFKVKVSIGASL